MTDTLADALPHEINRVREVQDHYKALRKFPNVMVEPQIAMMESTISRAIKASAAGDTVEMVRCYEELQGWKE